VPPSHRRPPTAAPPWRRRSSGWPPVPMGGGHLAQRRPRLLAALRAAGGRRASARASPPSDGHGRALARHLVPDLCRAVRRRGAARRLPGRRARRGRFCSPRRGGRRAARGLAAQGGPSTLSGVHQAGPVDDARRTAGGREVVTFTSSSTVATSSTAAPAVPPASRHRPGPQPPRRGDADVRRSPHDRRSGRHAAPGPPAPASPQPAPAARGLIFDRRADPRHRDVHTEAVVDLRRPRRDLDGRGGSRSSAPPPPALDRQLQPSSAGRWTAPVMARRGAPPAGDER
jgi:hypothetical protein